MINLKLLWKPYPLSPPKHNFYMTLGIALFVFLFLFYFQPFGFSQLSFNYRLWISLGFGLVTVIASGLVSVLFSKFLSNHFREDHWRNIDEIILVMINFLAVGLANYFFSYWVGIMDFSFRHLTSMLLSTIAIGIFPVSFFILTNYMRLLRKNLQDAEKMNADIYQTKPSTSNIVLHFQSENARENFRCALDDLLLIESTGNYVTVHVFQNGKSRKQLLRNSLARISASLPETPVLFHCHRTYIVNMQYIKSVTGNSQGYKIRLENYFELIPIARSKSRIFRSLLSKMRSSPQFSQASNN